VRRARTNIFLNLVFSLFPFLMALLVVRYASTVFVPAVLGLFLLFRRVAELIANSMQLGTSQMLRYYLPRTDKPGVKVLHVLSGLTILVAGALVFAIVLMAALDFWAEAAFPGNPAQRGLIFWAGMLGISAIFEFLCAGLLLAQKWVLAYNLLEGLYMGLWMLVASLLLQQDQITVIGLATVQVFTSCALSVLIFSLFLIGNAGSLTRATFARYGAVLKESSSYSLPRSGITFLDVMLFFVGPWLLRHTPESAGYLIIAFYLLRVVKIVINPVSKMISIYVTSLVSRSDHALLTKGMSLLFGGLVYLGFFSLSFLSPWAYSLLRIWLGKPYLAGAALQFTQVLLLSFPAYVVYQGLREQIEMVSKKPLNLYILSAALLTVTGVYTLSSPFFPLNASITYAYLLAFLVAAALSFTIVKRYLAPASFFGYPRMLLGAAAVFLVNTLLADWFGPRALSLNVAGLALGMASSALIIVAFLFAAGPSPFVREAVIFIMPDRLNPFRVRRETRV
jgi:hypothetical protein